MLDRIDVSGNPVNWIDPWGLLNTETGVDLGDAIDAVIAINITNLERVGLIPPLVGLPLGLLLTPVSDMLLPSPLLSNEEHYLNLIRIDFELYLLEEECNKIREEFNEIRRERVQNGGRATDFPVNRIYYQ